VQSEPREGSVRDGLIAILPRLKRFAEVLIGERDEGVALLSRALQLMLDEHHRYQRGTPLDRWAFGEIYRLWLQELRSHANPMRRSTRVDQSFALLADDLADDEDERPDPLTLSFIANLPPQQRGTLLLIYGEGFSHEDASEVLDCSIDTIEARLVRASAGLADQLVDEAPSAAADIQPLHAAKAEDIEAEDIPAEDIAMVGEAS
jgi:RNA polymerase sigma-70 factor (ECF subfamily)